MNEKLKKKLITMYEENSLCQKIFRISEYSRK